MVKLVKSSDNEDAYKARNRDTASAMAPLDCSQKVTFEAL